MSGGHQRKLTLSLLAKDGCINIPFKIAIFGFNPRRNAITEIIQNTATLHMPKG